MTRYIALNMGECSGIGPELIIKSLSSDEAASFSAVIVVGDRELFSYVSKTLRIPMPFTAFASSDDELTKCMLAGEKKIFYDIKCVDMEHFEFGHPSENTGLAAYTTTAKAVSLIQNSYASALVTLPADSRALALAGLDVLTYDDMIDELTLSKRGLRMLDADGVKIFSHTYNTRLRLALDEITFEKILDTIIRVDSLTQENSVFSLDKPLAIASVNPHREDSLVWEEEERDILIPAIEKARQIGIDIIGPVSADVLMHRAEKGLYRAVIALFYDQAHIAAMSMSFEKTVTVVWGWPFPVIRVDRPAMLERAGKNMSAPYCLNQALRVARKYVDLGVIS